MELSSHSSCLLAAVCRDKALKSDRTLPAQQQTADRQLAEEHRSEDVTPSLSFLLICLV